MAQRYLKKRVSVSNKEKTVLLGAPVPSSLFNYVSLFCEADGCTKTSVINPIIKKWVKKAQKQFSEQELIEVVVKRGWTAWKERPNKKKIFQAFIKELRNELLSRLPEEMVEKIIKGIKYEKNKEDQAKNEQRELI